MKAKVTIPTPFLTERRVVIGNQPLFAMAFAAFGVVRHPRLRSVLCGSRGRVTCEWMPRSPKTSLIAHANTGSPTDGLRW